MFRVGEISKFSEVKPKWISKDIVAMGVGDFSTLEKAHFHAVSCANSLQRDP